MSIAPWWVWVALWNGADKRAAFFSGKGSIRKPFGFYILGLDIGWRNTPWWRQ